MRTAHIARICAASSLDSCGQLNVDADGIVNNLLSMEYILELTSGVIGRIVELLRLSARCSRI
jgi:hypothetical protein